MRRAVPPSFLLCVSVSLWLYLNDVGKHTKEWGSSAARRRPDQDIFGSRGGGRRLSRPQSGGGARRDGRRHGRVGGGQIDAAPPARGAGSAQFGESDNRRV